MDIYRDKYQEFFDSCRSSDLISMEEYRLASAAPLLLDALENLIQYSEHHDGGCPCDSGLGAYYKAQDAIKAAKGTGDGPVQD